MTSSLMAFRVNTKTGSILRKDVELKASRLKKGGMMLESSFRRGSNIQLVQDMTENTVFVSEGANMDISSFLLIHENPPILKF